MDHPILIIAIKLNQSSLSMPMMPRKKQSNYWKVSKLKRENHSHINHLDGMPIFSKNFLKNGLKSKLGQGKISAWLGIELWRFSRMRFNDSFWIKSFLIRFEYRPSILPRAMQHHSITYVKAVRMVSYETWPTEKSFLLSQWIVLCFLCFSFLSPMGSRLGCPQRK